MKLKQIISHLEYIAPPALQESYDNSGLLIGDPEWEISSALVCLDSTEEVIEEAIANNCNLVIAHHPVIFSGLKRITGRTYIERVVTKAIRNDIAVYAIHTNLDNVHSGVNEMIGRKIGLKNMRILSPKTGLLRKLVTFCPPEQAEEVRQAMFAAGAGKIGDYDQCSFNSEGEGTFRGNEGTEPFIGKPGEHTAAKETRIETIFPAYLERQVLRALIESHPYEEVAYDIFHLENRFERVGSGMVGELENEEEEMDFLRRMSEVFGAKGIRYSSLRKRRVRKVALCGGSGSFLLNDAISAGADIFITGDFKYHQFFDADNKIVIADIGHYESEQFTCELLKEALNKKFPNFAVRLTETNTNPINYLQK